MGYTTTFPEPVGDRTTNGYWTNPTWGGGSDPQVAEEILPFATITKSTYPVAH